MSMCKGILINKPQSRDWSTSNVMNVCQYKKLSVWVVLKNPPQLNLPTSIVFSFVALHPSC